MAPWPPAVSPAASLSPAHRAAKAPSRLFRSPTARVLLDPSVIPWTEYFLSFWKSPVSPSLPPLPG
jgi:hypothetical protein